MFTFWVNSLALDSFLSLWMELSYFCLEICRGIGALQAAGDHKKLGDSHSLSRV